MKIFLALLSQAIGIALLILLAYLMIAPARAASVAFPQEPKPSYSKIVEISGEKKILLPDGRVIPLGQSTICSENCPDTVGAITPGNRPRLWLLTIPAGVVAVIALWPDRSPRPLSPAQPVLPVTPPRMPRHVPSRTADVPEPVTLATVGVGLAAMARLFGRREAA